MSKLTDLNGVRVLVTNDDGIDSPGILALATAALNAGAEVIVVAPVDNRSGAAAAIGPIGRQLAPPNDPAPWHGIEVHTIDAPPAAAVLAAAVAPPAEAVVPRWVRISFLNSSSGATGKIAASALFVSRSCLRNVAQRSHWRRWRRTGALVRRSPSATSPSSSRTSSQVSSRASAASASDTRARTSSDLTDGTVVSIASAICS